MSHSIRDRNIGGREGRQNHYRCILLMGVGGVELVLRGNPRSSHITSTSLTHIQYSMACIMSCHCIKRREQSYNHTGLSLLSHTRGLQTFWFVNSQLQWRFFHFRGKVAASSSHNFIYSSIQQKHNW